MTIEATVNLICIDCGGVFELTADNRKWFEDKGLSLPKRCGACRRAKRENATR